MEGTFLKPDHEYRCPWIFNQTLNTLNVIKILFILLILQIKWYNFDLFKNEILSFAFVIWMMNEHDESCKVTVLIFVLNVNFLLSSVVRAAWLGALRRSPCRQHEGQVPHRISSFLGNRCEAGYHGARFHLKRTRDYLGHNKCIIQWVIVIWILSFTSILDYLVVLLNLQW